jgi:formylglycine-generating enzyme required for sulfatase activity
MKKQTVLLITISFISILFASTMTVHTTTGDHEFEISEITSITFDAGTQPPENMIFVEGGTFQMGDRFNEGGDDELPLHNVTLNNFYIGITEVTQAQYSAVTGNNPASGYGEGDNFPVYSVSWNDALIYCNALSTLEGLTPCYADIGTNTTCDWTANGYRLPTEAEWEYVARGGIYNADNYKYSGTTNNLIDYAWYAGNNTPYGAKEVATKLPNQLDIYDMSGNEWEWCWDWHNAGYYSNSPSSNPHGPGNGAYRIRRGGPWGHIDYRSRVAFRAGTVPYNSGVDIGLRLVRNSPY